MAVEFPINVYGLTRQYERVKIASAVIIADANPVGGTIFYIDDTADGAYEFYDTDGNIVENIQVGDKPYAYKVVTPGSKDKYYVYHDELYEGRWTYYKDGAYVDESLNISYNDISGKTNTEIVMAKDSGAYVTADSNGSPTIWYQLQQVRNAKVGGCDDWFIPSMNETEELRKAIGSQTVSDSVDPVILPAGKVTGGVIAGTADGQAHYIYHGGREVYICYPSATKFLDTYMWTSNGASYGVSYAIPWDYDTQEYLAANHGDKSYLNSVFFTRAF